MVESTKQADLFPRTLILVGCLLVFRLFYGAIVPDTPVGDEAYYWDWGRHLDYGYYSKPPFIAWLYAFVDWLGGGSLFAIRATAAILGTLSLLLLFLLARSLLDSATGWAAVLLAAAAPANSVLSFFLTIDAPLVVCWTTALWMFWRIVSGEGKAGSYLLLFLALGIGHLAKQMMMVFPVLAVLFLVLHSDTRQWLRKPGLMLVLFGSFVSLTPPLLWNAKNDWITFQHTSHHFEAVSDGGNIVLERIEGFFEFLATQLGVIGPIAAIFLFPVCILSLRSIRSASRPIRFLLVFGAVPLAGMLVLALRQGLQPNWPAVFYISCFILTGAFFSGRLSCPFPPVKWKALFPWAIGVSAVLAGYFYFAPLVFEAIGKEGHKADPNRRLQGHAELCRKLDEVRAELPGSEDLFLVAIGHRNTASYLAFGLSDQPRVYLWDGTAEIQSQYELWNNPEEDGLVGSDGLILVANNEPVPAALSNSFTRLEKVGEFEVSYGYDRSAPYEVYRGYDFQEWPDAP